jgi:hypothetical protein
MTKLPLKSKIIPTNSLSIEMSKAVSRKRKILCPLASPKPNPSMCSKALSISVT